MKRLLTTTLILLLLVFQIQAQNLDLGKLSKKDGFVTFYLDEEKGKIYLEIDKLDHEFLYVSSLTAGVGSNDLGLDRGQLGDTRIVEFRRSGNKVLLVHKNYDYRAYSDNPYEVKSIQDAFAESVLWGFEISQKNGDKLIVDATSFYMQDTHGVADRLNQRRQGSYKA
ncbi:MAG TPA: peptidase, partial [Algoriphagus sp.]|nr:peptidase [Algoriphagus sp.]